MSHLMAAAKMRDYYRWHSRIYDLTRWAFLFGRRNLVSLAARGPEPARVLEIGCGTGSNLVALARVFRSAEIVGLDCSADMLAIARRKVAPLGPRVVLHHEAYPSLAASRGGLFDLIVFSYCLSMINPGCEEVLRHCVSDLRPGGRIAVVDFHDTPLRLFRQWMALNHVRMEGQLLPALAACGVEQTRAEIRPGLGGLWRWFHWVGEKRLSV